MKYNEPELKEAIKKFEYLIETTPDSAESLYVFKNFLNTILRIKPNSLNVPTAAFMSIVKREKPIVYKLLQQLAVKNDVLYFLTNINMGYENAKRCVKEIQSNLK